MNEKISNGYQLNGEYHFDFDRYFAYTYNACMNNILGNNNFDIEQLIVFILDEFEEYPMYKVNLFPEIVQKKFYKHKRLNIFASTDGRTADFCYGSEKENVDYLLPMFESLRRKQGKEEAKIYTLLSSEKGLVAHKSFFKAPKLDIQGCYNDDLIPHYNSVCNLIESGDTGLVLFHGIPGTGKTSILRHLMTKEFDRKFLFIPSGYAEILGEPGFNNLLIQDAYKRSVLIIEDAESLIKKTPERSSGLSNILNLTDGLMKDVFGCLVIATFNTTVSAIDPALLRGGRLKDKYEFKKLSADKVYNINNIREEMTLSQIFCKSQEVEEKHAIGFRMN